MTTLSKIKKRLFVFGCSYTAYCWPSWADFLSCEYEVYENWGLAGIGNRAIAERITECHAKNNFTKDDVIIVQWSTHIRNDFFHQEGRLTKRVGGWKTAGSVFNYLNGEIYDSKWYETFFDEEAYFMHTLNHILMTQMFLENTGATWYMTSIGDVRNLGTDIDITSSYGEQSIFYKIKERFSSINEPYFGYRVTPSLKVYNKPIWEDRKDRWVQPIGAWVIDNNKDPFYSFTGENGEKFSDYHPKPSHHKDWLVKFLIPKLEIEPDIEKYNKIAEDCDILRTRMINDTKRDYEMALFHWKFNLPKWPNMIKGFITF